MQTKQSKPDPSSVERRVLEILQELLIEMGAERGVHAVAPQAHLDRDLGLGSLERVELLVRLETEFGARLSDQVLSDTKTVEELVRAVLNHGSESREKPRSRPAPVAAAAATPESARTLNEVLRKHVELDPDRPHIHLWQDEGEWHTLSYGELARRAAAVARGLRERGVAPGHTVALMLPTGEAFFFSFFGALLAGAVPVPIYPPFRADQIEEYAHRQALILRQAEVRVLITFQRAKALARLLKPRIPSLTEVITAEALEASSAAPPDGSTGFFGNAAATEAALLQYTSGSTGEPKGVVLSHANLIANIRGIGAGVRVRPTDVGVSWLPLYHDMGLIGCWLFCLYYGLPITLLSPLSFLSRPERWLWAIHHSRGTLSPAPNFAYELCIRKVEDEALEGLDLSSWRAALNGAEPVSVDTLERFVARFARYGFRPEAMLPVYGLAESSVALTIPPLGRPPRIDWVRRDSFERQGKAAPVSSSQEGALRFISVGSPLPGHEVRVVDESGQLQPERKVGRVLFRGPSATAGYYRNPQATQAILRDGWLDSGDLAYWAEGELFITGRVKDVIIKGGRNIYPQEVEEIAASVGGIRRGCVAAFGATDSRMGTERLVVVAETRELEPAARERITGEMTQKVAAALGIPPDVVLLVPPHAVPKTSSGKIRRDACRRLYLQGKLTQGKWPAWIQVGRLFLGSVSAWMRRACRWILDLGYTAYVMAAATMTALPAWTLVALLPGPRATSRLGRLWARACLRLSGCPLRIEGREHLAGPGPWVLVANHTSYVDVLVLLAALPIDFRFVAKRELSSVPLIRTYLRKGGHLAVDRFDPSQSVADSGWIEEALRAGSSVLVFPEGTFTRATGLRPFRVGAFKAAVAASRPFCPIALRGTRDILRDESFLLKRGPIQVVIGTPHAPESDDWREIVRLRDCARAHIAQHCGEPTLDLVAGASPPQPAPDGTRPGPKPHAQRGPLDKLRMGWVRNMMRVSASALKRRSPMEDHPSKPPLPPS